MSKQVAVNLQMYGDFDVLSTVAVLLSPSNMEKSDVSRIVNEVTKNNAKTYSGDKAIKELKSYGFTVVNSVSCTIGGEL